MTRRRLTVATAALLLGAAGCGPGVGVELPAPLASQPAVSSPGLLVWPTGLRWVQVTGFGLPVSSSAGPHYTGAGRAWAFSRDRFGAVLAVLHLVARTSPYAGPAVFGPTIGEQVVGPDAAAFAARVNDMYNQLLPGADAADGAPLGPADVVPLGIRVDAIGSDVVSVTVLVDSRSTGRAAIVVQVRWVDADWRLVAPPGGDWASVRTEAVGSFVLLPVRR